MQLAKALKNISENAISNSNKPIKFSHLQKLANQSMLHDTHCFLWKLENPWLLDEERIVSIKKKSQNGGNIFLKALANRFRLTPKLIRRVREQQSCLWPKFY